jgi:hypothetical protein
MTIKKASSHIALGKRRPSSIRSRQIGSHMGTPHSYLSIVWTRPGTPQTREMY